MILRRLYELAEREGLLQDPAFDVAPVACLIQIGERGDFRGLTDLRERHEQPAKRKGGKPKVVVDKGRQMLVPVRPIVLDMPKPKKKQPQLETPRWKTTDPASSGREKPAVFLADIIARVLPVQTLIDAKQRDKFGAQRSTFWRFLDYAASETDDAALRALQRFGQWLKNDESVDEMLAREIEAKGFTISQICTFAWLPDDNVGAPILQRTAVRDWWSEFFAADRVKQEADIFRARCQITETEAAIPSSIKSRINGLVPIGCRADAYLVTAVDASESYGLSGAATGMVSARGVDGFTRALNALIANGLADRPKTSLRVGGTMFLFWTRNREPTDLMAFDTPEPEQVARLIRSAEAGRPAYGATERDFYCLTLSGNSARVVARNYLEAPLPDVERNLGCWFRDLEIINWYTGEKTALFPLWMLANCTIRSGDDVPPDLPTVLMAAALQGMPVPQHVLAACLRRMRLEVGASDETVRRNCFRPARMGLIQLILRRFANSGEATMNDSSTEVRLGYACGQLLAFLARCQSPRDYGASAQVLDRYFGSASTAPRSVFPFLLRLNRHHIRKVRDENPGFAFNLEEELETRLALFQPSQVAAPDFPAVQCLPEQGRFALGFYHQRAEYRATSLERKAAAQQGQPASST